MRPRAYPTRASGSSFGGCFGVTAIGCGIAAACLLLCCGAGTFMSWRTGERDQKELAKANRHWEAGRKDEAAAAYKAFLGRDSSHFPSDADRPVIYHRLVEYELGKGDSEAAKNWVEKALDNKVELAPTNKAVADLVPVVRAEREQRVAADRKRKEAEAKRREDEQRAEAKRREDEREAAAKRKREERVAVELVQARLEPFRTAAGDDTQIVGVDWKNTGNRPVRAVHANIKAFDAQGRELYSAPNYTIYAVFNDRPGVAPGETYTKPKGEGHVLPPLLPRPATRVTVEITKAEEKGLD